MDWYGNRYKQRAMDDAQEQASSLVMVTVSEQITIRANADELWQLVWDPATSPLVSDNTLSAFTLPGTPARQVGEMQMHVVAYDNGVLIGVIEEVIELGPGYRAVTRSRSSLQPSTTTTLLLPLDQGGCVLRYRTEHPVPAHAANAVQAELQASSRIYLSRVRELAEATLGSSIQNPRGQRDG